MRYSAPLHISSVSLSCGEFEIVDGFADLPDEIGQGDANGLAVLGFVADPSDDDHERADKARKAQDKADAELAAAIEAEQAASAPDAAPAGDEPPVDPPVADEVAVSIVNLGFGKHKRVNAAGERFGDVMKKPEAEALGLSIAKAVKA